MSSQERNPRNYSSDRSSEREDNDSSTSSPAYISHTHRAGQYHPIITTLMTEEEEDSKHQRANSSSEENFDSNSEQSSGKGALDIGQLTYNGSAKPTPRGGGGSTMAANRRYMQLGESQMSEQ